MWSWTFLAWSALASPVTALPHPDEVGLELPEVSWPEEATESCHAMLVLAADGAVDQVVSDACEPALRPILDGLIELRGEPDPEVPRRVVRVSVRDDEEVLHLAPLLPAFRGEPLLRVPRPSKDQPERLRCLLEVEVEAERTVAAVAREGCPARFGARLERELAAWTWPKLHEAPVGEGRVTLTVPFSVYRQTPHVGGRPVAVTEWSVVPVHRVFPAYPAVAATSQPAEVQCKVRAFIDEAGVPYEARVTECPDVFHSAVVDAVAQWRWIPAVHDGEPVKAQFVVAMKFRR